MMRQLNAASGNDFVAATRTVAMLEAIASRLNVVDRLHLGRLMVSSGHSITLTAVRHERRRVTVLLLRRYFVLALPQASYRRLGPDRPGGGCL
jgi:hypothetical protein